MVKICKPCHLSPTYNKKTISDELILVYFNENEMKKMSNNLSKDTDKSLKMNELRIPAFGTHHNR